MRARAGALAAVLLTACGSPTHPPPGQPSRSAAPSGQAKPVNPANIKRVARDMPPGYEVTSGLPDAASPLVIWGVQPGAPDRKAKPARCAALADPGNGHDQSAQGLSGSGPGGIVDAVVVALPESVELDQDVVDACGQWTMTAGHTTISVHLVDPPHIDGTDTVAMVADIISSVESGTEIDSRAYTFIAYLGGHYAFTTLVTDPGAAHPALAPQFAADLLVKTVSTLRS
jgi:Domain of unknown function (DUF5642)